MTTKMNAQWKSVSDINIQNSNNPTIQTIDIPKDSTIKWNNIKSHKKIKFKIIDDIELIDKYFVERNVQHLNQVQGSPFIIKSLKSLIRITSLLHSRKIF